MDKLEWKLQRILRIRLDACLERVRGAYAWELFWGEPDDHSDAPSWEAFDNPHDDVIAVTSVVIRERQYWITAQRFPDAGGERWARRIRFLCSIPGLAGLRKTRFAIWRNDPRTTQAFRHSIATRNPIRYFSSSKELLEHFQSTAL